MNPKSHLIALLLLALLVSACGGTAAEPTDLPATATQAPPTNTPPPPPTETPLPTDTPAPTATPTTVPSPTPEISAETLEIMAEIQKQVVNLRGLQPAGDLQTEVLNKAKVEQYLADKLTREFTEDEEIRELVTLSYLGLIPPDFDIRDFAQQLYGEQLLGFYEPEQDKMFLLQETKFDPLEQMSYAHEFTHALQDAAYDIDGKLAFSDAQCEGQAERCAALRALMEGDASLASGLWMLGNLSADQQAEITQAGEKSYPMMENAPLVYQEDMGFPYSVGAQFVGSLYQQGGWEAVNAAYLDPPISSEQIMHPERYPADVPLEVTLPDLSSTLGDGWILLDEDTLGEWHTLLLLSSGIDPAARIPVETALTGVTGWGGDKYQVYINPDTGQAVLVLKTQWESEDEAAEFLNLLNQHVVARFDLGDGDETLRTGFQDMQLGYAQFQLDEDTTYYILSPSEEISLSVLEAVLEK